jgi:hypothetical protein
MADKNYPKGVMVFSPNSKAPDFVKGSVVISLNELIQYCKDNPNLLTEYKGNKQLKLQLLDGKKGLYFVVDEYKPERQHAEPSTADDTLPF